MAVIPFKREPSTAGRTHNVLCRLLVLVYVSNATGSKNPICHDVLFSRSSADNHSLLSGLFSTARGIIKNEATLAFLVNLVDWQKLKPV